MQKDKQRPQNYVFILQNDDRERERKQFDKDATRSNVEIKEVRGLFGLWDQVYDRRVVRTLETNSKWIPNRREVRIRDYILNFCSFFVQFCKG